MSFQSCGLLLTCLGLVGWSSAAVAQAPVKEKLDDTGFVSVFDGKSLAGWHVSTKTGHSATSQNKSGGKWEIVDGAITGSQDVPGNGGIVLTDKSYTNFEVIVEMKNDFGPDSGLFLRSNDLGQAYQYMVDYHSAGNLGGIYGEGLSGGIHSRNFNFLDKVENIEAVANPFKLPFETKEWPGLWKHGEWNELRARIEGNPPKIVTWINRVRIMEFADSEARHPDSGMVALQVHGGGDYTKEFVRYKGVKVKELK